MNDTFIGNQILDLLRRRLFGLQLTDSCITFRPGHDRPLLVVSEAARSRGNTVRFSLRRRTPPTRDADHTADFEPMLDFDRPAPVSPPSFPQPEQSAAPDPAAPHRTLHRRDAAATPPEVSEPTGVIRFETDADAQTGRPRSRPGRPDRKRRGTPASAVPGPWSRPPRRTKHLCPTSRRAVPPHRRCWTMTSPTSPRILTPPPSPPRRLPMTPPRPRARAPALRTLPALRPAV